MPTATRLRRVSRAAGLLVSLLLPLVAQPRAASAADDAPGCGDVPSIPRFAGSVILGCEARPFDELELPTGPLELTPAGSWAPAAARRVSGRLTRLLYVAPAEHSVLEVYRNYETALAALGADPIYRCVDAECGAISNGMAPFAYRPGRQIPTPEAARLAFNVLSESRYLSAGLARPGGGELGVSLLVGRETGSPFPETQDRTLVLLEVAEPQAMEDRMVLVEADEMASAIASEGRFASYGILFDFDSAALKPESEPTLAEIAKLLTADPALELYVVGHTDGSGGLDYNLKLSRARAGAVVDALTGRFRIASSRLRPEGVGPLAPVATNGTEEGRAKNRRVELVKR